MLEKGVASAGYKPDKTFRIGGFYDATATMSLIDGKNYVIPSLKMKFKKNILMTRHPDEWSHHPTYRNTKVRISSNKLGNIHLRAFL